MHTTDRSCRYYIQDVFFWRLAAPVAPTGKAIVHWIVCINAIKIWYISALADVDLQYEHVLGRNNTMADCYPDGNFPSKMSCNCNSLLKTLCGFRLM